MKGDSERNASDQITTMLVLHTHATLHMTEGLGQLNAIHKIDQNEEQARHATTIKAPYRSSPEWSYLMRALSRHLPPHGLG